MEKDTFLTLYQPFHLTSGIARGGKKHSVFVLSLTVVCKWPICLWCASHTQNGSKWERERMLAHCGEIHVQNLVLCNPPSSYTTALDYNLWAGHGFRRKHLAQVINKGTRNKKLAKVQRGSYHCTGVPEEQIFLKCIFSWKFAFSSSLLLEFSTIHSFHLNITCASLWAISMSVALLSLINLTAQSYSYLLRSSIVVIGGYS